MKSGFKILLTLLILFQGCNEKETQKKKISEFEQITEKKNTEFINLNSSKNIKSEPQTDFSFIENIKKVELPHRDSTNFDNHKVGKLLTKEQIQELSLDKVFEIHPNAYDAHKIGINYAVNLSDNYKSIVFYNYFVDNELGSTLVNYDSDYNILDHKMIAMDEIAESVLRTESTIEKNRIIITNFQFWNETTKETEIVEIQVNGKLKTSG
ncbi:hypothetical protein [uncultured Polaribacter sp.]|uniref:hypothetical protein n=1 Tax=uncultured Polaribacter sp. TaxID=174711 RepID=UPI002604997C|nr:hypothetical protein [uncultured Polaribacter sp.]